MNSDPCPHHLSQLELRAGPSSCQGSLSHLPLSRPTPKPSFVTSGRPQVPSSFTKLRMGKRRSRVSHAMSAFPQLLIWIKWSCLVCPSQVALSITVYEATSLSLLHRVCPGGSLGVWDPHDSPAARTVPFQGVYPAPPCANTHTKSCIHQ